MFKFLKDKLKGALDKFSKDVEEIVEEPVEETQEKETPQSEDGANEISEDKVSEEETQKEDTTSDVESEDEVSEGVEETAEEETQEKETVEEPKDEVETIAEDTASEIDEVSEDKSVEQEPIEEQASKGFLGRLFKKEEPAQPKEGILSRLTKFQLSEEKFESLFWELEIVLLENNVAVEVIERIKSDLKEALTQDKVSRKGVEELIKETLRATIKDILSIEPISLLQEKKPLIITIIGVNGSGKTTTLAKLIKYFQDHNKSMVVAAADTFRAAAIQQLEEHTTKLGVKLIKHDYGADPAAVGFDAVKHAEAKGLDVVLIDSAGRLHSNDNLMNELKKLIRVATPDIKIFVGEAITGNDCVEQAKLFDEAVGIDAIILAKADVDEKGGAAISASYVTKKPVLFLGTGQEYKDLEVFNSEKVLEGLGL